MAFLLLGAPELSKNSPGRKAGVPVPPRPLAENHRVPPGTRSVTTLPRADGRPLGSGPMVERVAAADRALQCENVGNKAGGGTRRPYG